MTPLVLVDGSYYLFRCFYAMPPLTNDKGEPTGAIRGVQNALTRLKNRYQPTHMAVAFDLRAPTFRHRMSSAYKANRNQMPKELAAQIAPLHAMIRAQGIPLLTHEGYEADDILGTLATIANKRGIRVILSSGDKDLCQLVNASITLEDPFKDMCLDPQGVFDKHGVHPHQIIDFLTLVGDASDGVAGVAGVGAKTAAAWLNEYETLDNLLKHKDTLKGRGKNALKAVNLEALAQDKKLVTLATDLDIITDLSDLTLKAPDVHALWEIYSALDFKKELSELDMAHTHLKEAPKANNPAPTLFTIDRCKPPVPSTPQVLENAHLDAPLVDGVLPFYPLSNEETRARLLQSEHFALLPLVTGNPLTEPLIGLAIATLEGVYYAPLTEVDKSDLLDDASIPLGFWRDLTDALQDPKRTKIGYDLKSVAQVLYRLGVGLNDITANAGFLMDVMLASYVQNPAQTHTICAIAQQAGIKTPSEKQTLEASGHKAKSATLARLTPDEAQDYIAQNTSALWGIYAHFLKEMDAEALTLLYALDAPVSDVLAKMEQAGIRIDKVHLLRLQTRFGEQMASLEEQAKALAGTSFLLSSPKQLGTVLFEDLGLPGGKKTKSGQYGTSEAVLQGIAHPLAFVALSYRSLAKLKGTYVDGLLGAEVNADLTHGRVHTCYHQALTQTSRLSSQAPNLQSIPARTEEGRRLREAFIAPAGKVIVSADYSQIELRLMAHYSQEPAMLDAFTQGVDIHTRTMAELLGKAPKEVTAFERAGAKAINFGILYGMSAFGLAKQLGISDKDAQGYIERYFARYPRVHTYMEHAKTQAQDIGYVTTLLGRKIYMPDVKSPKAMVRQGALRAAINAPLQGSAAEIIKLAMLAVCPHMTEGTRLLLQVHDELVFEVPEENADVKMHAIRKAMQDIPAFAKTLGLNLAMDVPLEVSIAQGANWHEAH